MKKSNAYKIGEELFKVAVKAKMAKPHRSIAEMEECSSLVCRHDAKFWLAIGEYVEKNFRRKKK